MTRLFDVRAGEARGRVIGFSGLLLLIIGAHTVLEMARDALLLTGPGPRALGLVYMAIAAGTIPGAALAAFAGERFGQRQALGATLLVAILGPLVLYAVPMTHAMAVTTYVLSGLVGSIVVPQFWTLVATALTVGQGRRLLGLIAAGGVLGGVVGPGVASVALLFLPVKALLLVSSSVFVAAAAVLGLIPVTERAQPSVRAPRVPLVASLRAFREQPFLARVALIVLLSTATFLGIDYLFKSSLARGLTSAEIGPFVAHYYLGLNLFSLAVQVLLTGSVVRRLGVLPALVVTPLLLVLGALVALVGGGALPGVLVFKGIDGSLRYSLHRVTGELIYLPVPAAQRQRTKPLIDGALARLAQTVTGAGLLALGGTSLVAPRPMAALVAVLAAAWLAVVITTRRSYLRLLRSAVTSGSVDAFDSSDPVDLETAQLLVQRLASEDPFEVEGAMTILSRRGRAGFVPALVLLHPDERVLVHALEIFGASSRSDWFAPARRLLADPREVVRVAAARALARNEQLDPASLADDVGLRARGYAAVRMALRDASSEVAAHATVTALLDQPGEAGDSARLGLIAAIADAAPTRLLSTLLRRLAAEPRRTREKTELLALAIAQQKDVALVPQLVSFLVVREGREAVRAALVALGDPALDEVRRTLCDPGAARRLRLHMPKTLARFGTKRAAEWLLDAIESEADGLIRYKAIRALRVLVTENRIFVDRRRTERLCCAELEEHLRRLALRQALDDRATSSGAGLLLELLSENAAHAIERAFQLLQIAHPRQGVHHAYIAYRSRDAFAHANGAELVDALLRRRDQQRLRGLFRLVTDDLPLADLVGRARVLVPRIALTREDSLAALLHGRDPVLAMLARRLGTTADDRPLARVIPLGRAR